MYKLSDIVSKQVIVLSGARILGTVADAAFAPTLKKASGLLILDEEENDENFLVLPLNKVFSVNENCVVVRSLGSPLSVFSKTPNNPMNLPCCNQDGKILGKINDIELDGKFDVVSFTVGENSYAADMLLSFSDSLVVFNDSGEPIKLPKPSFRKKKESDKNIKVSATQKKAVEIKAEIPKISVQSMPTGDNAPTENIPVEESQNKVTTPTAAPTPAPSMGAPDFSFLLGKKVMQPLCTQDGRLIAAENDVITSGIIELATKENKLVQLTLRAL